MRQYALLAEYSSRVIIIHASPPLSIHACDMPSTIPFPYVYFHDLFSAPASRPSHTQVHECVCATMLHPPLSIMFVIVHTHLSRSSRRAICAS